MTRWLRKYWWAATAVVAAVGIGLGIFLSRPSHPARALPPARARVYTAFDACLLTDAAGVGSAQAAPVWSGMQAASLQSSGKVSFLSVYGPDTAANAVPYVNTLVQRQCNLVLAVEDECKVTVYHYTDKRGYNGIKGSGFKINPGDSENDAGPFFTDCSPADLTAPNAFKKPGITNAKSQFMIEFQVPKSALVPLRGGRGQFVFTIPKGITIPREDLGYSGPTGEWSSQ